jgi:hypothetical protein
MLSCLKTNDIDATGLFLEAGTLHFGLAISLLTGISTTIVSDSPLTRTESPSEFWGGRWNKQIHGLLKVKISLDLDEVASFKRLHLTHPPHSLLLGSALSTSH